MTLTITLLTCKRNQPEGETSYAERTLRTVLTHLHSKSNHEIKLHIADDTRASDPSHQKKLVNIADLEFGIAASVSCSHGQGYGANYNLAMQAVHTDSDFILPLEDDWELVKDLDVDPILDLLANSLQGKHYAGCVRLGYLGYTQQLEGDFFSHQGLHWIQLNPFSAEPHVFAGHPRIESRAWSRHVGPWQLGLGPGETEWEVSHRNTARQGVIWPISLTKPEGELFVHIGTIQAAL